jgi:hypothetical protein
MNRPRVLPLVFLAFAAVISGCESDPPTDPDPKALVSARTTESDELAMWLARAPGPPAELSERIGRELNLIRDSFGDSIPELRTIDFMLPWESNRLWLEVEPSLFDSVEAELSTVLDPVNTRLGGMIDRPLFGYGFEWVFITFDHTVHPGCLGREYLELPGVTSAMPSGYLGDWPNVYAAVAGETSRYLFFHGDGDCPAGCTENDYWYFRVEDNQVAHVGSWEYPQLTPEPPWFEEAIQLRHDYRHQGSSCNGTP